ncbi:MAG: hypothetical protein FVQ83_06870 [Chloroflexi bacterium]|nr:hypothetical protein [Chloroflexota bacterium]
MREWNLQPGYPLSLVLAADARLGNLDYTDDQIWELILGSGDPAAVLLQTTYGLRARNMRIFPRFVEGDATVSDPAEFDTPLVIHSFFPNYVRLSYSPFPGINISAEYWVPECHVISGRFRLQNNGVTPREFQLEWVVLLNPTSEGEMISPEKVDGAIILKGKTNGLAPVVFITGGPEEMSSPFTALKHKIELLPGQTRKLTWAHAATPETETSFRLARNTCARKWEAEVARIEMTNASQIEIYTGDPDWDTAFALGQKAAINLLHSPTQYLQHTSLVNTRQPSQGHSTQGDGSDYSHLWNGQTPLDTWYLSSILLPSELEIVKGLLLNFLDTQNEDGRIDWKPGLAGQRSRMLATPLLASLTWRIYQHSEDLDFLKLAFPKILEFLQSWFSDQQDRDGDGIPEWDHPMQSGFDDNPTFAHWQAWAQGAEIKLFESPSLCAFLYRECQILIEIAKLINRNEPIPALQAFADNLRSAVDASWYGRTAAYRYWDRDTHHNQRGELLGTRKGPGEIYLDMVFDLPARILIRIKTHGESTLNTKVFVHATTPGGKHRVERIGREQFQWYLGLGNATGKNLYADLERIQVESLPEDAEVSLHLVDFQLQDHTLLLPLWAKIPDEKTAGKIIQRSITNPKRYYHPYGLPACPMPPKAKEAVICESVWLPWNALIGEGLLSYGARAEAADLVSRVMAGITKTLKAEGAFHKHHHADTGEGVGERNALGGLPPLGLFLDTLGVRIISPWRVAIEAFNPFPWPVILKFRGLTIDCLSNHTSLTFPDGHKVTVDDDLPQIVDGKALNIIQKENTDEFIP